MIDALISFCLALWTAISPGYAHAPDAHAIAVAATQAVLDDADGAPVYSSHDEDLAALAYTAVRESSLRANAIGDCRDKRDPATCLAHGAFQLHGPCGLKSLRQQARCELALLHEGARRCPQAPMAILWGACHMRDPSTGIDVATLAERRERRTRSLLLEVIGIGVAELQH